MKKKSQRFLMVKGFYHIFRQEPFYVLKTILRRPFSYFWRYILSFKTKRGHIPEGAYLYGFKDIKSFKKSINTKKSQLILGSSYCQRPKNCPTIRFSSICPLENNICYTCPISTYKKLLKRNDSFIMITTALELGKKIISLQKTHPEKDIIFILSSCDLSQEIFTFFSYILGIKGIAFSLRGNICKNFKSFKHAEEGKKKAQTYLDSKQNMLIKELLILRKKTL